MMVDASSEQPNPLRLRKARRTGILICLVSLSIAATFVAGLASGSYWAIALPVAVGVFTAVTLAFWIGFTINTVKGIPAEADHYEGRSARLMAKILCLASIAVGAAFVWGLAQQSYWAIALPVAVVVLTLVSMVFWIGWAIITQRTTLPQTESADGSEPASLGEQADVPANPGP